MTEEMKKDLLVISNHPPAGWGKEQKAGWDTIDHIPFPNVPPTFSFQEVSEMAEILLGKIGEWKNTHAEGKISIQGEFTLSSILTLAIQRYDGWVLTFPTTERVVEEKDGKKMSTFKFVRWR